MMIIQGMFGLIYSNPKGLRKNCNENRNADK